MKKQLLFSTVLVCVSGLALSVPSKPKVQGDFNLMAITTSMTVQGYSSVNRTLSASYNTSLTSPAGATAVMNVPEGLGVASPVPFVIQNLQATGGTAAGEVIHYWNSAPTIPKGQPEVMKGAGTTSGSWKGGSTGYPDPMGWKYLRAGQFALDETSKVPGTYKVNISYVGELTVPMTEKQEFLGPLKINKPESPALDTSKSIEVAWTHVPNAVRYTVLASGKNAAGKAVYWENAYNAPTTWYLKGAAAAVKDGKLVSPDSCKVQIPAAIFSGPVSLSVTGYSTESKGSGVLNPWGWAQTIASMQLGQ